MTIKDAKIRLHRGTIYLSHVPDNKDAVFSKALQNNVGTCRYHGGHRRWVISLSREAVAGLRSMGLTLPPEFMAWEAEQDSLSVNRRKANKFKAFVDRELRALLTKSGVYFDPGLKTHQLVAVAYAIRLPAAAILMDTGTGKTAAMATVMQAFADRLGFKRMLVVAPKSILDVSWGEDIDRWAKDLSWVNISDPPRRPETTECPVCHKTFKRHVQWRHMKTHMPSTITNIGEEAAKQRMYEREPNLFPPSQEDKRSRLLRALASDTQVYLINPESFKLVMEDIMEQDWDSVIIDESSMLKSPKSQITNKMQLFGGSVSRRYIMTATPRPNTSLDFWGQMAFLDQCLGGNYFAFRDKYYYEDYTGFKWLPKSDDVDDTIWNIVSQRSYRVKLEDCVDLPGETTERMIVELDGGLKKHYDDMLVNMSLEVKNSSFVEKRNVSGKIIKNSHGKPVMVKVDSQGKIIDTEWRLVQMNKLAQITSGYVFDNDGNPTFLGESPKITTTVNMAKRLIEDEDRFVVIWVRFTKTEGKAIEEALSKYGVSTLHGQTKNVKASVEAFKSKRNRVMIAHAASAKFGHTWTHSNVAIFHSYDYSWENFYQAKRRIYRMGQTRPVTYLVNMAKGTVDEEIMKRVFEKEEASDSVIDDNIFSRLLKSRNLDKDGS